MRKKIEFCVVIGWSVAGRKRLQGEVGVAGGLERTGPNPGH